MSESASGAGRREGRGGPDADEDGPRGSGSAPVERSRQSRVQLSRFLAAGWLVFAGTVLTLAPLRDHVWWDAWAAWSVELATWASGASVRAACFAFGAATLSFGLLDLILCVAVGPRRS